jgi:hypothetical protein
MRFSGLIHLLPLHFAALIAASFIYPNYTDVAGRVKRQIGHFGDSEKFFLVAFCP